jgi:hypothetical protein
LKEDIQSKNKNNENTTQKTEKTKSTTTKTGDEPKDDQRRPLQNPFKSPIDAVKFSNTIE